MLLGGTLRGMWRLQQTDDGWCVYRGETLVATCSNHDEAMLALQDAVAAQLATLEPGVAPGDAPGVLPERWRGEIAVSKATDDGRDFTECTWTWRDPNRVPLPLMLQTSTEIGHFGAVWAGTMVALELRGEGVVYAEGTFFDTDDGRKFRDMLAAQGRMGVSVDPGKVEWEDVCLEMDACGFCVDGFTKFLDYQIIGVTGTPFPAFDSTFIELFDGAPAAVAELAEDAEPADAVVAAAAPVRPPKAWFEDPKLSEPTPLKITDDGRVFGLVADFSTCHTGWGGVCITAPESVALDLIHTGVVRTREGVDIATAPLVYHADHAPTDDPQMTATRARDHYAHTGLAWADYRVGVTPGLGIWLAGAVRPQFMDELHLRTLRASALSGDWRDLGDGRLSLCAVLTVNSPGFPIPRALAASGAPYPRAASTRVRVRDGLVVAAHGLGLVAQPPQGDVLARSIAALGRGRTRDDAALARVIASLVDVVTEIRAQLAVLDRRTRPMNAAVRDDLARRIRGE